MDDLEKAVVVGTVMKVIGIAVAFGSVLFWIPLALYSWAWWLAWLR